MKWAFLAVLIGDSIQKLVDSSKLIDPCEPPLLQPASYDMRVGGEYEIEGVPKTLTPAQQTIEIAPGAFAILTTLEKLNLPKNIVARTGLMSKYCLLGLNSTMGPQVDPGFKGLLTIPVVNMGNSAMTLRQGDPFLTVEFSETDQPVPRGWSELHGSVERMRRETAVGVKARPDFRLLADLDQKVRDLHTKFGELGRNVNNVLYALLFGLLAGVAAGFVLLILQR